MNYTKKIIILLSTYNGELYLKEQLNSIFSQDYKNFELLVRDDGSSDNTIKILNEYCKRHSNMSYYCGCNKKPARSFLDLMKMAPKADYYAFADQDDIWLPNKISSAIFLLKKNHADFYHSNFQMVDENLQEIPTIKKYDVQTIEQSAVLLTATGCTFVFSSKLRDLAISYKPHFLIMHDTWLFKIALSCGLSIVFDHVPHILYRQHSSNVLGGLKMSFIAKWRGRFKDFFRPKSSRSKEIKELLIGYAAYMDERTRKIVGNLAFYKHRSIFGRIKLAFNPSFCTGVCSKDTLFKIAIILKKY